jgi:hypothetical protein
MAGSCFEVIIVRKEDGDGRVILVNIGLGLA